MVEYVHYALKSLWKRTPAKFEALTAELTILLLTKCETLVAEVTHLLAQQRTVRASAMTVRNDTSKPN